MSEVRKRASRKHLEEVFPEQDDNFYFIAGYTSGGTPYGLTWDEARERERLEGEDIPDSQLPF